jgi:predicted RNase H-like HicB family nuclease
MMIDYSCRQAELTTLGEIGMPDHQVHVQIRHEDGSLWATVDEYPGVLATGDDLEELRESVEEGIRLMKTAPGEDLASFRLSELTLPGETTASAEVVPA